MDSRTPARLQCRQRRGYVARRCKPGVTTRHMLNALTYAILVVDLHATITFSNHSADQLLDCGGGALAGRPLSDILAGEGGQRPCELLLDAIASRQVWGGPVQFVCASQCACEGYVYVTPFPPRRDRMTGSMLCLLPARSNPRPALSGDVPHTPADVLASARPSLNEFRNPLSIILASAQLVRSYPHDQMLVVDCMTKIESAVQRMSHTMHTIAPIPHETAIGPAEPKRRPSGSAAANATGGD